MKPEDLDPSVLENECGVYYGLAKIGDAGDIHNMVMSIGWNPFYKNEKKTAEVHIINDFGKDFYGETLRIIIVGWMRPELDFDSLEALKEHIQLDIDQTHVHINELDNLDALKNDAHWTA